MSTRRPRYALPLVATLAAGGAAAGAAFAVADYVVRQMTAPARGRKPLQLGFTPFETGVRYEDVVFPGGHNTPLRGWLMVRSADAPALLVCNGYRARRSDMLGISSALWRAGFSVLVFDYTGYGDEPGPATLGYWELADARAALASLRDRFPAAPLGVMGFSMGAAIAIMVAAREPGVRAVVADSPFTDQREILRYQVGREFRLNDTLQGEWIVRLLLSLVDRRLSRLFGFRLSDVDPLRDVVRIAPRPLLLFHGEADTIIPVEHTRRMEAAARAAGAAVEATYIPGVNHCEGYFAERTGYCERVARFFATHVGRPDPAGSPIGGSLLPARGGQSAPGAQNGQAPSDTVSPPAALS